MNTPKLSPMVKKFLRDDLVEESKRLKLSGATRSTAVDELSQFASSKVNSTVWPSSRDVALAYTDGIIERLISEWPEPGVSSAFPYSSGWSTARVEPTFELSAARGWVDDKLFGYIDYSAMQLRSQGVVKSYAREVLRQVTQDHIDNSSNTVVIGQWRIQVQEYANNLIELELESWPNHNIE